MVEPGVDGSSGRVEPTSGPDASVPWVVDPFSCPMDSRISEAQWRDFSASLPLASAVASPALRAKGAARSAAVAATSAAFAENSVRYQATLQFLSSKFRGLLTAITGQ